MFGGGLHVNTVEKALRQAVFEHQVMAGDTAYNRLVLSASGHGVLCLDQGKLLS